MSRTERIRSMSTKKSGAAKVHGSARAMAIRTHVRAGGDADPGGISITLTGPSSSPPPVTSGYSTDPPL
jgi:hypothetical protein